MNPLGVVVIRDGQINETELVQAFSEMFDWGGSGELKNMERFAR